jgi:phage FluMu protein Com
LSLAIIKCQTCGKTLCEAIGEVKKICPRCKEITHVVVTSKGIINLSTPGKERVEDEQKMGKEL